MANYTLQPLEHDRYFHIYNRGINSTELFKNPQDYEFFLKRYVEYIEPVAETFAWCLMGNHFHLLVKILPEDKISFIKPKEKDKRNYPLQKKYDPTRQFSHLFDSYAKKFNYLYNRTGGLFETPFRRIMIEEDSYLKQLIFYIHSNPVKHGFVSKLSEYKWSSYSSIISDKSTHLQRERVIDWFNSKKDFIDYHNLRFSDDEFCIFDLDE
jgi:putative transposase